MNSPLDDAYLYTHIPEAEEALRSTLPESSHNFSRRFQRKMNQLLKYERRTPFGRAAAKAGRIAAGILVVILMLHTVLMGSVKAYREGVQEIIRQIRRKYTIFIVETDDQRPVTEFIPIEPPYIPEGFTVVNQHIGPLGLDISYSNNAGKMLVYSQLLVISNNNYIDTEDATVALLNLSGREIYVITEKDFTQVYWVDAGYQFDIGGNAGYEETLEIAKNIMSAMDNQKNN